MLMITELLKLEKKNFSAPDVVRRCGHGKLELATVEDQTLARVTLHPGWKWSESIKPMVHTESCLVHHIQYVISGRLKVVMDEGGEIELTPGDFVVIPPGHDAWVVGDEPFVCVDFSPDMKQYAQDSRDDRH
jgi:quercetin dioxygenase-like cupin family protein